MLIEIFSDTVCPWCFIGKRRLERALAMRPDIAVEIRWRAFQLNPWMPPEGMERAAYLQAKFGAQDATRIYDNIRRVGAAEDIAFRFDRIPRTPNTLDSHRLIRHAEGVGRQNDVVEALFAAYFLDGRDIGDIGVLTEIAAAAGLAPDAARAFLEGDAERDAVRAEDMRARQMGIQGVPCFVLDRSYAVSGAQEPEYFLPLFDLVRNGRAEAVAADG